MLHLEVNFYQISFQHAATPLMVGISHLHDYILFYLSIIFSVVVYALYIILNKFTYITNHWVSRYFLRRSVFDATSYVWLRLNHGTTIEIAWTIIPTIILILIALPSFALLYGIDEIIDPYLTVKVIGHQWFWSYEYMDIYLEKQNTNWSRICTKYKMKKLAELALTWRPLDSQILSMFDRLQQPIFSPFKPYNIAALTTNWGSRSDWTHKIQKLDENYTNLQFTEDQTALMNNKSLSGRFGLPILINYEGPKFNPIAVYLNYKGMRQVIFNNPLNIATLETYIDKTSVPVLIESVLKLSVKQSDVNMEAKTYVFDSYMVHEADLQLGDLRLLKTDHPLILPKETHIRFMITSEDVLHSWAVPSFGLKVDAVPGRINQISVFIKRPGVFYGQCSELCGVNHAFMPIEVYVFTNEMFLTYLYHLNTK